MAGKKKKDIELDEFDDDIEDFDFDSIDDLAFSSGAGAFAKKLAWQRLEQRADSIWLNSQLADWDEYLDIH